MAARTLLEILDEGVAAQRAGRLAEALASYRGALAIAPDNEATLKLGVDIFAKQRSWKALEEIGRRWTQLRPAHAPAWRALCEAALQQGQYAQAKNAYANVLDCAGPTAERLTIYARICLRAQAFAEAEKALADAEALRPNLTALLAEKAFLLTYRGQFDEAEAYARRCLAQDPEHIPAYMVLNQLKRGHFSDDEVRVLSELVRREGVPLNQRISGAFALADAYDARDEERAFAAYAYANQLCIERNDADGLSYDPAKSAARTDLLMTLFPSAPTPIAAHGPTPIFVVGMPRSGTTLVESTLAAHSHVFACGERPQMRQILTRYVETMSVPGAAEPSPRRLEEWAKAYGADLPKVATDYITDKLPLNFEAAGLIARLFPQAIVVNVRRNPLETGLSVFRNEFYRFMTFANRLEDIGHAYGQYARLVAHWERVLGPRFLTIQYEDFVANFAARAQALVEACGLAWEPACLDFHKSTRPISTLSTVQVRSPVTAGTGKVRRYRDRLEPLVRALEAARVDLETGELKATAA